MEDEGLEDVYQEKIVPATGSVSFGKSLSRLRGISKNKTRGQKDRIAVLVLSSASLPSADCHGVDIVR